MPKVLVMSGYGINCESETAHAFERAGALADVVHVNDLISKKKQISDYDIIAFPGGFSYGDDTGSGNAFANKVKNNLWNSMMEFIDSGKLMIGICNGFQAMVSLGLFALPGTEYGQRTAALLANTQSRYECRWVNIKHTESRCVFTQGMGIMHVPIAHGEGRFHCSDAVLKKLAESKQIVFRYCDGAGKDAGGVFPVNPNGAMADIAGICDRSGRILGMMPHPERGLYSVSEPEFHARKEIARRKGAALNELIESNFMIFKNAVEFFR